jgi:hypothetical protein
VPWCVGPDGSRRRNLARMDQRPAPDPAKLLADWMEWETGETPPGRVMSNLKTHGRRDLLEQLLAGPAAGDA